MNRVSWAWRENGTVGTIIRREGKGRKWKQKQGLFVEISCEVRDATARDCRGREMTALFLRKVRFKWA